MVRLIEGISSLSTDMFLFLVVKRLRDFYYLALWATVSILVSSKSFLIEELHEGSPKFSLPCLT